MTEMVAVRDLLSSVALANSRKQNRLSNKKNPQTHAAPNRIGSNIAAASKYHDRVRLISSRDVSCEIISRPFNTRIRIDVVASPRQIAMTVPIVTGWLKASVASKSLSAVVKSLTLQEIG